MEKQTFNTVTEFVNAVKAVDLEKLGALLHPSVQWQQPGSNRFSGTKTSRDEVFQMVGGMFEVSGNTMRLEDIKTIAVNGNEASVVLHWKASRAGAELDTENVDVYTVENGQITGVKVYAADLQQEDTFWGK
ncbi:MAG: nuclear transport factor 2 family protein [Filimonas sp.]|nr:nuclear transport factor 2 family protein [Filimonas sp.]